MNINEHVSVVLTQHGADVYNKWYSQFPTDIRPELKQAGDTLKDGLWHIMQVFGPHTCITGPLLFEGCEMTLPERYSSPSIEP